MSRRKAVGKKDIVPDAQYNNIIITKLINCIMFRGKKSKAEEITYSAIDNLAKKVKRDPMESFEDVIENLKPLVEVRSRRVGGATYQVPMDVTPDKALSYALKWLINSARKRKGEKAMTERLSAELVDAYNKKGAAYKKKEDMHKMAEANKAFSHYRW